MPDKEKLVVCPLSPKNGNKNGGPKGNVTMVVTLLVGLAALGTYQNIQLKNERESNDSIRKFMLTDINRTKHDLELLQLDIKDHVIKDGHPERVVDMVKQLSKDLDDHKSMNGHPALLEKMSAIEEKFTEIETQFRGLRDLRALDLEHSYHRLDSIEAWLSAHNKSEPSINSAQWERIKSAEQMIDMLWNNVYGESIPPRKPSLDLGKGAN